MRQLSVGIATVAIFAREGEAAAKCAGVSFGTTEWFDRLNYCGLLDPATPYTASTLKACATETASGTVPTLNADLVSILGGSTGCATCALTYAKSVAALKKDNPLSDCSTYDEMDNAVCVRYLYDALTEFNECSGVGATNDLRTGAVSTTCSYEDFYAWETKFRPLGEYITKNYVSTALAITSAISTRVPTGCATCLTDFGTAINAQYSAVNTACAAGITSDCLKSTYVFAALNNLVVCTGGPSFRTGNEVVPFTGTWPTGVVVTSAGQTCNDIGILYLNSYAVYEAFVTCAVDADSTTLQLFDTCVADFMTIPAIHTANAYGCTDCIINLYNDIVAQAHAKCTSSGPFHADCVASLNGKWGAIDNFYYCTSGTYGASVTGVRLSVEPTQCSADEIDAMTSAEMSYVSIFEAIEELGEDKDEDSMNLITISGIACASCYSRLAADMYNLVQINPLVALICANAYTAECATALEDVLTTFETCSGFAATADSPFQCTATEITAIQAAAIVDASYNLALSSLSVTQAVHSLDIQLDAIAEDLGTDLLCIHCFDNIMASIAALSDEELASCADLASIECLLVAGADLREFYSCAGFQFLSGSATQATTNAPATGETTVAAVTTPAPGATTTTAETTAKSATSFVVGVASFVAMMVTL